MHICLVKLAMTFGLYGCRIPQRTFPVFPRRENQPASPRTNRAHQTEIRFVFSVRCGLLVHWKEPNTLVFSKFQTLSAKHPGWGWGRCVHSQFTPLGFLC